MTPYRPIAASSSDTAAKPTSSRITNASPGDATWQAVVERRHVVERHRRIQPRAATAANRRHQRRPDRQWTALTVSTEEGVGELRLRQVHLRHTAVSVRAVCRTSPTTPMMVRQGPSSAPPTRTRRADRVVPPEQVRAAVSDIRMTGCEVGGVPIAISRPRTQRDPHDPEVVGRHRIALGGRCVAGIRRSRVPRCEARSDRRCRPSGSARRSPPPARPGARGARDQPLDEGVDRRVLAIFFADQRELRGQHAAR